MFTLQQTCSDFSNQQSQYACERDYGCTWHGCNVFFSSDTCKSECRRDFSKSCSHLTTSFSCTRYNNCFWFPDDTPPAVTKRPTKRPTRRPTNQPSNAVGSPINADEIPTGFISLTPPSETALECTSSCTNENICNCAYGSTGFSLGCTTAKYASLCQDVDEFDACIHPSLLDSYKQWYCPLYECIDGGGISKVHCNCKAYQSVCDSCPAFGGFCTLDIASNTFSEAKSISAVDACNIATCCDSATSDFERETCIENKGVISPAFSWSTTPKVCIAIENNSEHYM